MKIKIGELKKVIGSVVREMVEEKGSPLVPGKFYNVKYKDDPTEKAAKPMEYVSTAVGASGVALMTFKSPAGFTATRRADLWSVEGESSPEAVQNEKELGAAELADQAKKIDTSRENT